MKMKYLYYLLVISLFFGCYSEEEELVKPEDWCKRIITSQNSLDDSVKSVLWNDSVFTNLCKLSDTRKWAYEKYYEGFPDSLFVDYKDIYGELQKYGQKSGIPNIFVYWAAYRKEIWSAPILTRTNLPEIIVRGDCYLDDIWNETAHSCFALWDNAVHEYWYAGGTTGGSGSFGGGGISDPEIHVDSSLIKNKKALKIYKELASDVNNFFCKLLERYEGDKDKLNLDFVLEPDLIRNGKPINGLCVMGNGKATIYINESKLEARPAIDVARTYLHEALHAYIHAYNQTVHYAGNSSTLDEAWKEYEVICTNGNTQHEFMAKKEIQNIAAELERIHMNHEYFDLWKLDKTDSEYKEGDEVLFYEGLAWISLKETEVYKSLETEKQKRMNAIV